MPLHEGSHSATTRATVSKSVRFSSAAKSSMYRKSSYSSSLRPSATLLKMMSALVMLNRRPTRPVSLTSLAHSLMFMSSPFPPPKAQNAAYVSRKPGAHSSFGGGLPSFQCTRCFRTLGTWCTAAYAPVYVLLSS